MALFVFFSGMKTPHLLSNIWGLCCRRRLSPAGMGDCISQNTEGCKILLIPAWDACFWQQNPTGGIRDSGTIACGSRHMCGPTGRMSRAARRSHTARSSHTARVALNTRRSAHTARIARGSHTPRAARNARMQVTHLHASRNARRSRSNCMALHAGRAQHSERAFKTGCPQVSHDTHPQRMAGKSPRQCTHVTHCTHCAHYTRVTQLVKNSRRCA